ncbi:hypothetical protein KKE03_00430 [Patescibacteria group bacterium]|nr:hypothetical protein [Patescibacteria group bacterium]
MMKVKINDLSTKLQNHSDEWVVLSEDSSKIVASGKDFNKVMNRAQAEGVKHPVVTRAPKNYGAYIL